MERETVDRVDARAARRAWLRHAAAWAAAAGGSALLPGCDAGRAPADLPPLRLAMDLWPGYYPALLADDLGYLDEAGVLLKVSFPGNTDRMMAAFAAGQVDVVAVALGDLIHATHGRAPVQVLLVSDESAGGDAVLARRGFRVDDGLGRVRLATNLGGFGELFAREFLRQHRIRPERVAWFNADAAEVPRLLASGVVDLGHTWQPYVTEAVAGGAEMVFSSRQTPGLIADVVATSRATALRRAGELRRFLAAWLRAVDWWVAHPEQAMQRLARRLPRDAAAVSLDGVRLVGREENRRLLGRDGLPPGLAPVVDRYSEFFLDKGSLARPVVTSQFLRGDLLP
ncbi:ABC transporter substrate-binding protein [Ideonella sp.]|uniref:ABC transporter substrate-binding protein n=1 Tax=Ideonella sp. TaxID=1929293 RepID=UPI0035B136CE